MQKVRALVGRNQLISFFLLAYIITWGLWIPFVGPAARGSSTFEEIMVMWGLFGPAFAGIIITRFITSGGEDISLKKPLLAFILGLVLSASIVLLNISMSIESSWTIVRIIGLFLLSCLIALPPAYILSSTFSRNPAVRYLLRSLIKPRGFIVYYLIALLLPLLIDWVGSWISGISGQAAYYTPLPMTGWYAVKVVPIAFLYQAFYGNILGEEVGWRGFALPRLQVRFSPLVASLIIALLWFAWHLPLKWANPDAIPYIYYALSFIPSSILLTWLYNRTHGSLLAVGIAHVIGNVSGKIIFPITDFNLVIGFVVAFILIIADRMWGRLADVDSLDFLTGQEQKIAITPSNSA
jgi:membrane protease YdiL (CAAX protease family)